MRSGKINPVKPGKEVGSLIHNYCSSGDAEIESESEIFIYPRRAIQILWSTHTAHTLHTTLTLYHTVSHVQSYCVRGIILNRGGTPLESVQCSNWMCKENCS